MKKNNSEITNTKNYQTFLKQIKEQIRTSQIKAITSVNKVLIVLYYNIGREIYQKQNQEGWGAKIIKQLSRDLKNDFPKEKGFSERNIMFMLRFYKEYQDIEIVKQPVSLFQISWSHHIILIQKTKDKELRYWYMQRTIEEGWGRDTLRNMSQPIGISEYELTEVLPKEFLSSLPTIEMIENEFLNIEDKN